MSLFKRKHPDNFTIAKELFSTISGFGEPKKLSSEAKAILSQNKSRIENLATIAELCKPADTPEKLYWISKAYVWAGAKYRQQAILYLRQYIDVGAICNDVPQGFVDMGTYIVDQRNANIATIYENLADCYEGEYMFDDAIPWLQQACSLTPYFPAPTVKLAEVYTKKNELDTAISILKEAQNSPYYKLENFSSVIDARLKETLDKKKRGYVYRPRKRRN